MQSLEKKAIMYNKIVNKYANDLSIWSLNSTIIIGCNIETIIKILVFSNY